VNICSGCTLCCKVLGVEELAKARDVWCCHASKGTGCAIYAERPHTCRTFACLWLTQNLPPDARPDRVHGVLATTDDGSHVVLHEDPGWPGYASAALSTFFSTLTRDGKVSVVVRTGESMRTVGAAIPVVLQ